VESSAAEEINWDELLVEDDDMYLEPTRITIDVTAEPGEDGEPAIKLHIRAYGLTKKELLAVLAVAYDMVEVNMEEDDESDD
jgi:hypothetical protein